MNQYHNQYVSLSPTFSTSFQNNGYRLYQNQQETADYNNNAFSQNYNSNLNKYQQNPHYQRPYQQKIPYNSNFNMNRFESNQTYNPYQFNKEKYNTPYNPTNEVLEQSNFKVDKQLNTESGSNQAPYSMKIFYHVNIPSHSKQSKQSKLKSKFEFIDTKKQVELFKMPSLEELSSNDQVIDSIENITKTHISQISFHSNLKSNIEEQNIDSDLKIEYKKYKERLKNKETINVKAENEIRNGAKSLYFGRGYLDILGESMQLDKLVRLIFSMILRDNNTMDIEVMDLRNAESIYEEQSEKVDTNLNLEKDEATNLKEDQDVVIIPRVKAVIPKSLKIFETFEDIHREFNSTAKFLLSNTSNKITEQLKDNYSPPTQEPPIDLGTRYKLQSKPIFIQLKSLQIKSSESSKYKYSLNLTPRQFKPLPEPLLNAFKSQECLEIGGFLQAFHWPIKNLDFCWVFDINVDKNEDSGSNEKSKLLEYLQRTRNVIS